MDLTNDKDISTIISEINTEQNIERKEDIYEGHRILDGDMRHFVKKRLAQLWPNSSKYFRLYTGSVTRKTIGKLSKAYQKKPIRKLESEQESVEYSEILREGKFQKAAQEYDETYNLDEYACMWVNMIQTENEDGDFERDYVFRALNQSEFDRIVDRHTLKTKVFIVSMPASLVLEQIHGDNQLSTIQDEGEDTDKLKFYAMWSDKHHVLVAHNKKNGKHIRLPIIGNEKNENPAGRIPAYFDQKKGEASVPSRPSMPFADIELAACKSVLLSGCDVNALGKMIISHPEDQNIPKTLFDSPFTYLKLPQKKKADAKATTAEYINASPNIKEFGEITDKFEQAIVEEKGIGTETAGKSFTSGEDRTVALKTELDIIENNQTRYCEMEEDVFQIVKAFEDAAESGKFNSEKLFCGFPKHQPIQSRKSILEELKMEKELGTIEPWEKHVRLDPNLTEDEAREKEERIQAARQSELSGFFQTPEVSEQDANQAQ